MFEFNREMASLKLSDVLKGVVAYVDVWSNSKTDNYSEPFIQQLEEMGAKVTKRMNKHVTHVVFKSGHQATWDRAKKMGVKLVSVLWVASCKDCCEHIREELYPAINDSSTNPALNKRRHRCMYPKDTPVKSVENSKGMKRKLDQMMKNLTVQSPTFPPVSPTIINIENGIFTPPSSKISGGMELHVGVMREERECVLRRGPSIVAPSGFPSSSRLCGPVLVYDSSPIYLLDLPDSEVSPSDRSEDVAEFPSRTKKTPKKNTTTRKCVKKGTVALQSTLLKCQTSLERSCLDALEEPAIGQSPVGLNSRVIGGPTSSFKCDQAAVGSSKWVPSCVDGQGSPELLKRSEPTFDIDFHDYFSPTNLAEHGWRPRTRLLDLSPELCNLPSMEDGASRSGQARGKRRVLKGN